MQNYLPLSVHFGYALMLYTRQKYIYQVFTRNGGASFHDFIGSEYNVSYLSVSLLDKIT